MFVYHLLFALYYWRYSLSNSADAKKYYSAIDKDISLQPGAGFIEWLINRLDLIFSASYLDYFILFQTFGFLGFCLLYRTFLELFPTEPTKRLRSVMLLLLFLPNFHFWTCAIGKDSLIFFGITLAIWGLLRLRNRVPALVIGLVLVYFIRPHVAGMFLLSILLALLWGRGLAIRWRIVITVVSVMAFFILLPRITDFVGLEELSTQSVGDFLHKRQGYNLEGGSSVDIRGYNLPLKIFTFLYRPLFFDAKGLLWLLVSVENVIYLFFTFSSVSKHLWSVLWKYPISFFMRFNFFFFTIGTMLFSMSISNIGIAIRQKTMLIPSFTILVIAVFALKEYQAKGNTIQETRYDMEQPGEGGA